MKTLGLALLSALTLFGTAAQAAPRAPSYAKLGSAALHGAADAMLKRKELREWFIDRRGSAQKSRVLGQLKIVDIDLSKGLYRAKVATKANGQDGYPQIRSSVRIRKTQKRYTVLGARVTHVNDIWE